MCWDDYLQKGSLYRHHLTADELQRMFGMVDRNHRDGRAATEAGLSPEWRFQIAYNTVLTLATIGLHASGYRTNTSQPGHHAVTLESLGLSIGISVSTIQILQGFRKQRNASSYLQETLITDAELDQLSEITGDLQLALCTKLLAEHAELITEIRL